ncbi:hypothetical protein VOI54_17660 [Tamlana sp. 2201CG12-4]|uniref:hypothetical protein n=1 Tax=Tamlana sp. 2201CG12-4 TaxID=3112582 RepID=UPI002DBB1C5F|nr:hypothetical protein [Tamlana sp. 2201CG12-4]MEC3908859.1 hypothetical protein [Tamlana sp. 2201CG12-4]
MKYLFIIICLITLTSCSISDDTPDNEVSITQWSLINVSGGLAGINTDFESGIIVWRFNNLDGTLSVLNNNDDNSLEDGLDSGTYNHLFIEKDEDLFLTIDGIEYGLVTISEDTETFILNQNITSTGSGADLFIYTFEKSVVIVN